MADTTSSTAENCVGRLKSYVRTQKGMILAAEVFLSFVIICCYAASVYQGFSTVAIFEMIFSMVFFILFMMEIDKQIQVINWVWTDLFRAAIGALAYIITSLITVIGGAGDGPRIAGGVFGLVAGLLFAFDTYTIFLVVRSNRQHTAAPTDDRV